MLQLDKTRIAIRERNALDLCDLALRVLRHDFPRLTVALAMGAIPLAFVNHWLIGWMMDFEFLSGTSWNDDSDMILSFCWHSFLLIFFEGPLATIFLTAYLGQDMFFERPPWRRVLWDTLKLGPRIFVCHVVLRGLGFAWLLYASMDPFSDDFAISGWLFLLLIYIAIYRSVRPFINEIIILERTPLIARDPTAMTVRKRSGQLHGPSGGDLVGRWISSVLVGGLLFLMLFGVIVFSSGVLLNDWTIGRFMIQALMPMSMWMVVGYLAIVRFLYYLDIRIRQEGWEVELRLRAESVRWMERFA